MARSSVPGARMQRWAGTISPRDRHQVVAPHGLDNSDQELKTVGAQERFIQSCGPVHSFLYFGEFICSDTSQRSSVASVTRSDATGSWQCTHTTTAHEGRSRVGPGMHEQCSNGSPQQLYPDFPRSVSSCAATVSTLFTRWFSKTDALRSVILWRVLGDGSRHIRRSKDVLRSRPGQGRERRVVGRFKPLSTRDCVAR